MYLVMVAYIIKQIFDGFNYMCRYYMERSTRKQSVFSTFVVQYNKINKMSCTYFPDRLSWPLPGDEPLDVAPHFRSTLPPPI